MANCRPPWNGNALNPVKSVDNSGVFVHLWPSVLVSSSPSLSVLFSLSTSSVASVFCRGYSRGCLRGLERQATCGDLDWNDLPWPGRVPLFGMSLLAIMQSVDGRGTGWVGGIGNVSRGEGRRAG